MRFVDSEVGTSEMSSPLEDEYWATEVARPRLSNLTSVCGAWGLIVTIVLPRTSCRKLVSRLSVLESSTYAVRMVTKLFPPSAPPSNVISLTLTMLLVPEEEPPGSPLSLVPVNCRKARPRSS